MLLHSSSVMNGMIGCRRCTISPSTQAIVARVSAFAASSVAGQDRLGELDIPVAERAPGELIERVAASLNLKASIARRDAATAARDARRRSSD